LAAPMRRFDAVAAFLGIVCVVLLCSLVAVK
jgi:hypothetical protein